MARESRMRISRLLSQSIRSREPSSDMTEALHTIDDRMIVDVLDLGMRIGEAMLGVGSSAHEVTLAVTRVSRAYGLKSVHVDVTFDSITVGYHPGELFAPVTLLRVVKMSVPDHSKLQHLQALLVSIEGGLSLTEARRRFREVRRTPFPYRPMIGLIAQALLAMAVSIMFGAAPVIIAMTFLAAFCAALVQRLFAKLGVPLFFNQIAGGFVVTAVAIVVSVLGRAGIGIFEDIRPSVIVVSGIMMMLAGMAVVGAAQDAIDGFALTAGGRILDLVMRTLGVVLGILFGLELGQALGYSIELHADPPAFGSVAVQLIGAGLIAVAVAVMNGATFGTMLVSGLLGVVAMLGYVVLAGGLSLGAVAASGVGAFIASFIGVLIAHRFHVPAVAVTTAAIIPLVPGAAVFRGLLSIVQAEGAAEGLTFGASSLVVAAITGIALATGASFGIYLGTPVRATMRSVAKARVGVRR